MMKLPPLEYTFDNIVLGWREEAVSFAREHGYHLIVNSDHRPFYYSFGLQDVKSRWYEGIFELGLRSLLPIPFDVQRVTLDQGKLKVVTQGNTKVLINFKSLHLFDIDNCGDLGADQEIYDYTVHDMFDVIEGSRLSREIVLTLTDTFVETVSFVPSNRIDRNTAGEFKDIIVRSTILAADIKSFDCSPTVVRILLERKLKKDAIKQSSGRSLKIEHSYRHITKNRFRFNVEEALDERIIFHE